MPRSARWVLPGKPHHITQRGTGRQRVFYSRRDCRVYLEQLRVNAAAEHVLVLAFSLMTNHLHLIVVPPDEESLAIAIRRTHGRYAQYLNARKLRTGHLWQNRFFSCPLEDSHLWAALRYVERNPVRAGIVPSPQLYPYSSAQQHLTGIFPDKTPLDRAFWHDFGGSPAWAELLAVGNLTAEQSYHLRHCTYAGRPFGDDLFLEEIDTRFGRHWRRAHRGHSSAA